MLAYTDSSSGLLAYSEHTCHVSVSYCHILSAGTSGNTTCIILLFAKQVRRQCASSAKPVRKQCTDSVQAGEGSKQVVCRQSAGSTKAVLTQCLGLGSVYAMRR